MNRFRTFYAADGRSVAIGPIESASFATIPAVDGKSIEEASAVLRAAGFAPVASPQRFADPGWVVEGTLPPEGAGAPIGGRIDLLPERHAAADEEEGPMPEEVLLGQGIMPNLVGWTPEQAIEFLTRNGFTPWTREGYTQSVDAGLVMFTEPRANRQVTTAVIQVWVSLGWPVEPPPPPPPPLEVIRA